MYYACFFAILLSILAPWLAGLYLALGMAPVNTAFAACFAAGLTSCLVSRVTFRRFQIRILWYSLLFSLGYASLGFILGFAIFCLSTMHA